MSEFDIFFDEYENKHNCSPEKYECFEAGQQSKQGEVDKLQTEIDELQKKYDAMYNAFVVADDCRKEWHRCYVGIRQREDELQKRVKELELINFDSELHFDAAKEHIDHLQKRIDLALEKCHTGIRKQGGDYYLEVVQDILKGDQT